MSVSLHGALPFCHLTSNFAPERERDSASRRAESREKIGTLPYFRGFYRRHRGGRK